MKLKLFEANANTRLDALTAQTELIDKLPELFDVGIFNVDDALKQYTLIVKHPAFLGPRYVRFYHHEGCSITTNPNIHKSANIYFMKEVVRQLLLSANKLPCINWLKANGFVKEPKAVGFTKSESSWIKKLTHKSLIGVVQVGLESNDFWTQPVFDRPDDGAWCSMNTFNSVAGLEKAVAYEEERVKAILDEISKTSYTSFTIPRNDLFNICRATISQSVKLKRFE